MIREDQAGPTSILPHLQTGRKLSRSVETPLEVYFMGGCFVGTFAPGVAVQSIVVSNSCTPVATRLTAAYATSIRPRSRSVTGTEPISQEGMFRQNA